MLWKMLLLGQNPMTPAYSTQCIDYRGKAGVEVVYEKMMSQVCQNQVPTYQLSICFVPLPTCRNITEVKFYFAIDSSGKNGPLNGHAGAWFSHRAEVKDIPPWASHPWVPTPGQVHCIMQCIQCTFPLYTVCYMQASWGLSLFIWSINCSKCTWLGLSFIDRPITSQNNNKCMFLFSATFHWINKSHFLVSISYM